VGWESEVYISWPLMLVGVAGFERLERDIRHEKEKERIYEVGLCRCRWADSGMLSCPAPSDLLRY
jgi:hypothetical protein